MQELQIEAAVYQEAVHKLHTDMQHIPNGFIHAEPWHRYASEFAADATPDEIETFIDTLPYFHSTTDHDSIHLPPSHAIQFYGALALRSAVANPELHAHSIEAAGHVADMLGGKIKRQEVSSRTVSEFIEVLCRTNHLDIAVQVAQRYGKDPTALIGGRMDYLYNAVTTLEDHDIATDNNSKELWDMTTEALEELKNNHRGPHSTEQAVLKFCITRLYAQEPDNVAAYCLDNSLHFELAVATSANGETVDDTLLAQATKAIAAKRNMKSLADLAIIAGPNRERQVNKRVSLFDRSNRRLYKQYVFAAKSQIGVEEGNFARAFRFALASGSPWQLANVRNALKNTGDPELYQEIRSKYDPRKYGSVTFLVETTPMLIKKGDIAGAISLIENEPEDSRKLYWYGFTGAYITYEIERNGGVDLTASTIIDFATRDRNPEADMGFAYATYYDQLCEAGLLEAAEELKTRAQSAGPIHARSFNYFASPTITKGAIRSGDWLTAMHGEHLPNPEEGLDEAQYLVLIAGGIHRARIQRKQQEAQKIKELPK